MTIYPVLSMLIMAIGCALSPGRRGFVVLPLGAALISVILYHSTFRVSPPNVWDVALLLLSVFLAILITPKGDRAFFRLWLIRDPRYRFHRRLYRIVLPYNEILGHPASNRDAAWIDRVALLGTRVIDELVALQPPDADWEVARDDYVELIRASIRGMQKGVTSEEARRIDEMRDDLETKSSELQQRYRKTSYARF